MDDPLLAPRAAFHGHRNLRAEMSTMPLQHSCNPTSPRASRPQSSQTILLEPVSLEKC